MNISFQRQLDVIDPARLSIPITLIGAGGIGAAAAMALAKMGVRHLTIYDDDRVEAHNLPSQMYRKSDLGSQKVTALAEVCSQYADTNIQPKPLRFHEQELRGVVVSGVDTMSARKTIWERVRYNAAVAVYVEARMAAEIARVYTMHPCDPDAIQKYERSLYSDDEAVDLPCTARATIYNSFMIAALVASQVKRFVNRQPFPHEIIFDFATHSLLTQ